MDPYIIIGLFVLSMLIPNIVWVLIMKRINRNKLKKNLTDRY